MKRKQIYLDEDSEQRLKSLASKRSRSEASLIREAVTRYLKQEETPAPEPEDNPILKLIGIARKGRPDAAAQHDRYLYGTPE